MFLAKYRVDLVGRGSFRPRGSGTLSIWLNAVMRKYLFNIVIHGLISHFTMFEEWGEWAVSVAGPRAWGLGPVWLHTVLQSEADDRTSRIDPSEETIEIFTMTEEGMEEWRIVVQRKSGGHIMLIPRGMKAAHHVWKTSRTGRE
jgi:hypothetical protein